jgi:chromatin remodeling complex protein RSC6
MATKKKNSAFMQPVELSADLEAVVGAGPMPRTEVIKKFWEYIKKHDCQDKKNRRNINPDAKLAKILGKNTVNMFEVPKKISAHLKS